MKEYSIMDGNEACVTAAYLLSEVCGIYPITPATSMGSLADKWSYYKKNIFNDNVKVVEMQSEAGAAALMHGALQAGSLATTFTASQGLLLMIPSMYKMAGEMLPGVIHVASRSIATHALSIYGDHQDIYAVRTTGFAMLASSNVQEAYHMSLIAHLSAIKGSIPFLHFFDGFRTSHEINKIKILGLNDIYPLIDLNKLKEFRDRSFNIGKNITRGTSQTEEVYFQNTEARNKDYLYLPETVNSIMQDINRITGMDYKLFNYYGSPNARNIIIAMGSVTDTIKLVVDELNNIGEEVGVLIVHLYRPFSINHFLEVIPKEVERIAVLDRTKESGSIGEPLFLDVTTALKDTDITIIGGRYGLSGRNTDPSQIKAIFDALDNGTLNNNFTIGIEDDITNLNLPINDFKLSKKYKEVKIFGFGSDGMVSASKNILKVIGEKANNFVQGYFHYDSKKSGGVTTSYLRIDDNPINAPFYPTDLALIVVSKDSYLEKFDVLDGIIDGGVFLLNSNKTDEEINRYLPNNVKEELVNKNIRFIIVDTSILDEKYNLNGKINNILATIILNILGCGLEDVEFKKVISEMYSKLDPIVIENNILAMNEAFDYLREFDKHLFTFEETEEINETKNITDELLRRRGNLLTVADFIDHRDGTYEGGMSKSDRSKITNKVPKWNKEACIECNQCAFVCPHSVIRPFSLTEEEIKEAGLDMSEVIPSIGEENKYFYISVAESNCTGCGLCIDVCPGKDNKKALVWGKYDERLDKISQYLFNNIRNDTNFNKFTIKGCGFQKPRFEFCGACAGCGETSYIKTLTNLYGDEIVIANATGCSSIYGASLPNTPYSIPWINSLFEDNAEFGLGLHTVYKKNKDRIKEIMNESYNIVDNEVRELYDLWLNNSEDSKTTLYVKGKLNTLKIPQELKCLLDYIPHRKVWIIGGDGWAYDIGYGGLDHVLHSNEDVKILVLDTEVYSNTGGQTSKSTKPGAIAEFSAIGKNTNKKDLFKIAMAIPNVYVASVCLGANMMQTIKAFKEAYEHKGPSIIIAYSPCIEQGITGGLRNSLKQEKLLVESGYNILMRYVPKEEKLYIDSKEPDFSKYETIFKKELRYKNLENINKEDYQKLYDKNIDEAKLRYNYFKNLSENKIEAI